MRTATFTYDDDAVCAECGTNDSIHYNVFIMHKDGRVHDDPDFASYCDRCGGEPLEMITINEVKSC